MRDLAVKFPRDETTTTTTVDYNGDIFALVYLLGDARLSLSRKLPFLNANSLFTRRVISQKESFHYLHE